MTTGADFVQTRKSGKNERLIDKDRLCNDLVKRWSIADKKKEDLIRAVMADVVTPIVVSQPTVDAVPVVRCKDCTYSRPFSAVVFLCTRYADSRLKTDYCSYGKRKDGDHHEG